MAAFASKGRQGINIDLFDDQHKGLVELINTLHDSIKGGKGYNAGLTLELLSFYIATQFRSEEKLFQEHGYPEYVQHKEEHNDFTKHILESKDSLKSGKPEESAELLSFLMNWLFKHILVTDKKTVLFLITRIYFRLVLFSM